MLTLILWARPFVITWATNLHIMEDHFCRSPDGSRLAGYYIVPTLGRGPPTFFLAYLAQTLAFKPCRLPPQSLRQLHPLLLWESNTLFVVSKVLTDRVRQTVE